jgi:CheY-like chemotaxis protein
MSGEAFDAVLMDLQMPELDGLSATREIRADGRFADLPIIAMTAHAMVEERERCFAAGMNDHVTKPVEPEALYQTLARWFRRGAAMPARPASGAKRAAAVDGVLPQVAGVDSASGLKRVAGNRALYLSLLEKFVAGQADVPVQLRTALAAGDRALAERLAHTLKGVAGNIGAQAVQAAAGTVEGAIRGNADPGAAIGTLENTLAAIIGPLRAALSASGAAEAPAAPSGSVESAGEALKKLDAYLADADGEAADYLSERADVLRAALGAERFAGIRKAVEGYDFEEALSRLRAATRA